MYKGMIVIKLENLINIGICKLGKKKLIDTNKIRDGCHTFDELYEYRAKLFSIICN